MAVEALSLSAETLLLSIDPAEGGLAGPKKRVLRAVRAAGGTPDSALAELKEDGLVRGGLGLLGGRVALIDRGPPARRFRELQDAIQSGALDDERDGELFVLLAWSGVLAARLPRHERRKAASRLRAIGQTLTDAPGAAAPSAVIAGLLVTGDGDDDLLDGSGLTASGLSPDYDSGGGTDFSAGGGGI